MTHSLPTLNDLSFDDEISAATVPVLVELTAEWCGPCRLLAPILQELAAENVGALKVFAVDGDECSLLATRLRIRAFPTVLVMREGKEVARHVGLTTKRKLLDLVASSQPKSLPASAAE